LGDTARTFGVSSAQFDGAKTLVDTHPKDKKAAMQATGNQVEQIASRSTLVKHLPLGFRKTTNYIGPRNWGHNKYPVLPSD